MTELNLSINLEPLRQQAKRTIDQNASRMLLRFISDLPGQDRLYSAKEQEALLISERLAENGPLTARDVPFLWRESNRQGVSLLDKAAQVLTRAYESQEAASLIDDLRLAAKERVSLASNPAQIEQAKEIDWSVIEPYLR